MWAVNNKNHKPQTWEFNNSPRVQFTLKAELFSTLLFFFLPVEFAKAVKEEIVKLEGKSEEMCFPPSFSSFKEAFLS